MIARLLIALFSVGVALPAAAQTMDHTTHGMAMDAPPAPASDAPAPRPGLAASQYWGTAAMERAYADMARENGGMIFHQIFFNLAEVQVRRGRDGYRWDGEAWIGGDIDRLVLKSEGEGSFHGSIDHAEVQALYAHALDPYWNLQAGARHDLKPGRARTYATVGIEGLAPYWFDIEAALFVSEKGDILARAEGWHDARLTQYLVIQPRIEMNFAAQNVAATRTGAGLSDVELGLRLRYEKSREFAPYVGVSWERKIGRTARFARDDGEDTGGVSLTLGIRTWF